MALDWLGEVYRDAGIFYSAPKNDNLWIYHADRVPVGSQSHQAQLAGLRVREMMKLWLTNPKADIWAFAVPFTSSRELWFMSTRAVDYPKPVAIALAWHMHQAAEGPYPDMMEPNNTSFFGSKMAFATAIRAFAIMSRARRFEFQVLEGGIRADLHRTIADTTFTRLKPDLAKIDQDGFTPKGSECVDECLVQIEDAAEHDSRIGEFARFLMKHRPPQRDGGGWARSRR
jgi:hypothetical protein